MKRVVLGIDPGIAITGYGVIAEQDQQTLVLEYGVIRTAASTPFPQRLRALYDELSALIERHRPDAIAVEELFFARNARTALNVGHARGVVLLAAAQSDASFHQYKPVEVKQAITGYGAADKRQMQEMIRLLLALEAIPRPDDAADALAIALCHLHTTAWSFKNKD
ncbi:MAG: crossover junction endodeoxyribonuclease RuvC [Chloroflexi bacterium]|nr:crossover junction endodeoxyribonuclease RuvC [Chloroflexota bacterium]